MRTSKTPIHPQVGVYCYMKNHKPWICCYPFHISCGFMSKVFYAWSQINTLGPVHPSIKAPKLWDQIWQDEQQITKPSSGWCMPLHGKLQPMDVLSPMPHILWVHGQGMTSLEPNQYTGVLSIHALDNPSWD